MVAEQRPVLLGILKEELYEGEADEKTNRPTWMAEKLSTRPNKLLDCGVGAGCGANSPMNNLIIGVVAQPIRSGRATSDLHGNRRATLTHGFIKNTIGWPAYSFPSDSSARMDGTVAGAKHECFLSHCPAPKRGWWKYHRAGASAGYACPFPLRVFGWRKAAGLGLVLGAETGLLAGRAVLRIEYVTAPEQGVFGFHGHGSESCNRTSATR
jgi:hypothetical protein